MILIILRKIFIYILVKKLTNWWNKPKSNKSDQVQEEILQTLKSLNQTIQPIHTEGQTSDDESVPQPSQMKFNRKNDQIVSYKKPKSSIFLTKDVIDNQKNFQKNLGNAFGAIYETTSRIESDMRTFADEYKNNELNASEDRQKYLQQQRELAEKKMEQDRQMRNEEMAREKEKADEFNRSRNQFLEKEEARWTAEMEQRERMKRNDYLLRTEKMKLEEIRRKEDNQRLDRERQDRLDREKSRENKFLEQHLQLETIKLKREAERKENEKREEKDAEDRRMRHEMELKRMDDNRQKLSLSIIASLLFVFASILLFKIFV